MNTGISLSNRFENALIQTLDQYLRPPTPPHLAESIRYSCLTPGKRIRPRLLLTCAQMLSLAIEQVMPAAVALELIHCFTLIHDDLPCMDNDDWRRGLPSNHKKFGETLALLAGDALLALAWNVFLDAGLPAERLLRGSRRLTSAVGSAGVIGGQAAESLLNAHSTFAQLQQMHRQKTGALFSAALLIPQDFAGIADESFEGQTLYQFADQLGLAFQIADDLEDPPTPTPAVTSVLHYLSREQAASYVLTHLPLAGEKLTQVWGTQALPLKEMAGEILSKTQQTL